MRRRLRALLRSTDRHLPGQVCRGAVHDPDRVAGGEEVAEVRAQAAGAAAQGDGADRREGICPLIAGPVRLAVAVFEQLVMS
jgi:hypothetical protein